MLLKKKIYNLKEVSNNCLDDLINLQWSHLGDIICQQLEKDSTDIKTAVEFLAQNLENNFARNITINTDNIIFEEKLLFGKPNDIDFKNVETNDKLTYLDILMTYLSMSLEENTGKNYDDITFNKIQDAFHKNPYILGITFRILSIAGKNYSCYSLEIISH